MANRHFAEIGDVWNHLLLAEILQIEKPKQYWESHAGRAQYILTPSSARDYGTIHFLSAASASPILRSCAYYRLLTQQRTYYPGSPLLSMSILGKECGYYFCDSNEQSLMNIADAAEDLSIPSSALRLVCGDGVASFRKLLTQESVPTSEILAHIDPYRPFVKSCGYNAFNLFLRLSDAGIKTTIWFSYGAIEIRDYILRYVAANSEQYSPQIIKSLWVGCITLAAIDDPVFDGQPGTLGCGIISSNLSDLAIDSCEKLGVALQEIYGDAKFDGKLCPVRFDCKEGLLLYDGSLH